MSAAGIIEAVDVFEEGDFDLPTRLPVLPPDQFGLQRFGKAFDGGIVVTVALAAHPLPGSGCLHPREGKP